MVPIVKLIIVEDEPQICKLLTTILDWDELGYDLASSFLSAREAWNYIESNHVDAVITDVKMPYMTGLELAQECYEKYPHIKFILISAYRDFSYAQEAIKYNVDAYITKPISYSELLGAAQKLQEKISQAQTTAFVDDEILIKRQQLFYNLKRSVINAEEFLKGLERTGITIQSGASVLTEFEVKPKRMSDYLVRVWKYEKELLYNAISKLMNQETDYGYFMLTEHSFQTIKGVAISKQTVAAAEHMENTESYCGALIENLSEILILETEITLDKPVELQAFCGAQTSKSGSSEHRTQADAGDDIIAKALEYIHLHYKEDIVLNDVANYVALHPNYFSVYFKQKMNERFIDYIAKVRIDLAKHLLKTTDIKTSAIAYNVGYKDPHYFYRIFKNAEGVTPTEYRNAQR